MRAMLMYRYSSRRCCTVIHVKKCRQENVGKSVVPMQELQAKIGFANFRLGRDFARWPFRKRMAVGNNVRIIAERQRQMHVLLDEQDRRPRFLERLERLDQLLHHDWRKAERQ